MTEVVAALIWQDDKFMICQRPKHKARGLLWEFVGGKVEKGETKTVNFKLNKEDFSFVGVDLKNQVAYGRHDICVGDLTTRITL